MMTWAETAAKNENISRAACDAWSLRSHQKAVAAVDAGKFKEEVVGVPMTEKGKTVLLEADETPRRDTSIEALARLRPVLRRRCLHGR